MRYIEICTLFDSLFSLSRTLTGKLTTKIIEKLEIFVIDKTMICLRNLRLSTKIVKINGIEDHLLDQIKKMVLDTSLKILLNKHINLVCLMKKELQIWEIE